MPDATSLPPEHDAMTDRDPATGHPRPPRREFKARGSFVKRCEGCNLPELNCLCPYQVKAESDAQVWLLTHSIEHYKPTNTGRLIGDVLTNTRVFTWYHGAPDEALATVIESTAANETYAPESAPDSRLAGRQLISTLCGHLEFGTS